MSYSYSRSSRNSMKTMEGRHNCLRRLEPKSEAGSIVIIVKETIAQFKGTTTEIKIIYLQTNN